MLKDTLLLEQAAEPGQFTSGCIKRFHERLPAIGIQPKPGPVGQSLVGARKGALQDEFADRAARRLSGGL